MSAARVTSRNGEADALGQLRRTQGGLGRPADHLLAPGLAQVRFYIDADILGLGKILGGLRNDVTYPGDPGAVVHKRHRPPCPIASPDVLDTDWIPEVAASGWLIVTRDSMITQNPNEIAAIRENNAKIWQHSTSGTPRPSGASSKYS
jgi:hypothetical protein